MRVRALIGGAICAALVAAVVTAPAIAADSLDLTVTGIVARLADVDATYIVAGNSAIEIEPDAVAGLAPGTTVRASLAIPLVTARELHVTSDVDLESAKGAAVAEQAEAPFAVTELTTVKAATALATSATHYVDVAVNVDGDGYTQPSNTQIKTAVATASAYWKSNTGGVFAGFTIRSIVPYYSDLGCDDADDEEWGEEGAEQFHRTLAHYLGATSDHLLVVGECRHDQKAAVGTVGDSLGSGGLVVVQADVFGTSDGQYYFDGLLAHEFGHNFSLNHANAQATDGCDFTDVPAYTDIDVCDTEEYGDYWSIMGYAMPEWWAPLLDIARRDQLGVANSTMLAKLTGTKTATYALKALGASGGLKGVKVAAPSGAIYYVEYRDGTGEADALYLDKSNGCSTGWEPSPVCPPSSLPSPRGPGVRVLRMYDDGSTRVEGVNTQIQDGAWAEDSLDAGDWWRSAEGDVNISINSAASGTASVTITTGAMSAVALSGVALSGIPAVGWPVTAVLTSRTPASATLTYRWFRDGVEIAGASAASFTPTAGMVGGHLSVRVEGRAPGFAPTQSVADDPAAIVAGLPTITGAVRVNAPLTAVRAPQVPAGATSTFQWIVNGADVGGATGPTFTPQVPDAGAQVAVRVASTWADGGGSHSAMLTSVAVGPVALATDWSTVENPQLAGVAEVGETLTVSDGSTTPASSGRTYQWIRDGVAIPGADDASYELIQADFGSYIHASVSHTTAGYAPYVLATEPVLVTGGEVNTVPPSVTGSATVGSTLTANPGSWAANFALGYQWVRNGEPVPGATSATYVTTASDLGTQLSVTVTGTHPELGQAAVSTEPATIASGILTAPTPTISGTFRVTYTLTVTHGTWTAGTAFTYRWYADGKPISGATGKTYKLTSSTAGKKITVTVTGTKAAYAAKTVTSAGKGVPIVGHPYITGTAKVGRTLTAHHATWTSGTAFTYRWYANGVAISGATKSTYKVTSGKAAKYITVKVTGRKSGFTTVTMTSPKSAKVAR